MRDVRSKDRANTIQHTHTISTQTTSRRMISDQGLCGRQQTTTKETNNEGLDINRLFITANTRASSSFTTS